MPTREEPQQPLAVELDPPTWADLQRGADRGALMLAGDDRIFLEKVTKRIGEELAKSPNAATVTIESGGFRRLGSLLGWLADRLDDRGVYVHASLYRLTCAIGNASAPKPMGTTEAELMAAAWRREWEKEHSAAEAD